MLIVAVSVEVPWTANRFWVAELWGGAAHCCSGLLGKATGIPRKREHVGPNPPRAPGSRGGGGKRLFTDFSSESALPANHPCPSSLFPSFAPGLLTTNLWVSKTQQHSNPHPPHPPPSLCCPLGLGPAAIPSSLPSLGPRRG